MEGKVFGIGYQKTGTTTLRDALRILGYRVKDTTPRALIPILRGRWAKVRSILAPYDAAEDTPWYKIYPELDRLFPGSKFILTERDPEGWYRSVSRHIGDYRAAMHEWVYGRGKGLPKDDKKHTLSIYTQHSAKVRAYFADRPEDLLILDFTQGDGWEKLCAFLGHPIPDVPFPHANNSKAPKKQIPAWRTRFRSWRHRFKSNLKIWYIDQRGWW